MIRKIVVCLLGSTLASFLTLPAWSADTLAIVQSRGRIKCGVASNAIGFAYPDSNGYWLGIDVAVCRAVSSAVFHDPDKVEFTSLSNQQRFTALQSGEIDVLAHNATQNFSREASLGLLFAHPIYYDAQAIMARKKRAEQIKSPQQLNNATVCVVPGSTTEVNISSFARMRKINLRLVALERFQDMVSAYLANRCDLIVMDGTSLAAVKLASNEPTEHVVLPYVLSKEPLAPAVRQGDNKWYKILNWSVMALLQAEELGITKANVEQMKQSRDPLIRQFLDSEAALALGLKRDFAYQIIKNLGNYGEIFEANLGKKSAFGLARGFNALWSKGGLHYPLPF